MVAGELHLPFCSIKRVTKLPFGVLMQHTQITCGKGKRQIFKGHFNPSRNHITSNISQKLLDVHPRRCHATPTPYLSDTNKI